MKKVINTLIEGIKKNIISNTENVYCPNGRYYLMMIFEAYNDYQESQCDGVDYIFNINNKEDMVCCVEGGMTAKEIADIYQRTESNSTPFFRFGCNYPEPKVFASYDSLRSSLIGELDELLGNVIAYPYAYESYKVIYTTYVTDVILGLYGVGNIVDEDALEELKRKINK